MNIQYDIRNNEYGKGIYVLEDIKENTCIWTYKLNNNVFEYSEAETITHLNSLPTLEEQQRFLDLTFGKGDKLCLITDDGKYVNHSESPNCKTDLITGNCYAIKDIKKDEEILENYQSYTHSPFLFPLLKKYNCEPTYYDFVIQSGSTSLN
jgi:hypothetical protein